MLTGLKQIFCAFVSLDLVADRTLSTFTAAKSKLVKDSTSLGPNVEAELQLLLIIDTVDVEGRLACNELHDSPIEPGKRHLDVEARSKFTPLL